MSEVAKPEFESSIERVNRKVVMQIGHKSIIFDYLNTVLYEHAEPYSMFDHAFRLNDGQSTGAFYLRSGLPELWDSLTKHHFPRRFNPYPTLADEEVIMNFITNDLDGRWEQFNVGE